MPLPSTRACTAKRISAEALERRVPCRWKPITYPSAFSRRYTFIDRCRAMTRFPASPSWDGHNALASGPRHPQIVRAQSSCSPQLVAFLTPPCRIQVHIPWRTYRSVDVRAESQPQCELEVTKLRRPRSESAV
jgi:hypothetical protein